MSTITKGRIMESQRPEELQNPISESNVEESSMSAKSSVKPAKTIIVSLLIIIAGIASGYGIYAATGGSSTANQQAASTTIQLSAADVKEGDIYGSDSDTFTDQAAGVLVKGGVHGEGSHHILRPGGPSQNVYLTSSVLDLNNFIDHEVEVWGETFEAQQAGWLMDVGKVKVIKLNAQKPFEEVE